MLALMARHYRLLAKALIAVAIIRIALYLSTYRKISRAIKLRQTSSASRTPAYLAVWAVQHASRVVPAASCLTRALALQYLLARDGQESIIRVGVAQTPARGFHAHAWVLQDENVLIGGNEEDLSRFTPIVDLPTKAA